MLLLALVLAASPQCVRARGCNERAGRVERLPTPPPDFSFAPVSGRGMTAACACTSPTGAKGETLTFTRASSAYCTKGDWNSGIVAGDMVLCTANQPRVMPGGDGTGGSGLMVEKAVTNTVSFPNAFDNAAWNSTSSGVADPTVTANAGTAPDNTATAERFQFNAVTSAQYTIRRQPATACTTSATNVGSIYIKGNAGAGGTLHLIMADSAWYCTACTYVADTWTRCEATRALNGVAGTLAFGNGAGLCATGQAQGAHDVLVWGAQCEVSTSAQPYATSLIVSADGTPAPRAAETASFTVPARFTVNSLSLTRETPWTKSNSTNDIALYAAYGAGSIQFYNATNGLDYCDQTNVSTNYGYSNIEATSSRLVCRVKSADGAFTATENGTVMTLDGPNSIASEASLIEIGQSGGASQTNGVIKDVCIDRHRNRCN